jgi:hypothetical protein
MPFPPIFSNVWDTTFPADTQAANLLGQDLRNFRTDVMQRLSLLSGTLANRPTPETVNATWGGAGFGLLYFATDTSQIFQWSGAAWVDITSSFYIPIVKKIDLTAQQANIALTNLVIPAANGYYRASGYIVLTQAGTISSLLPNIVISWTDADTNIIESSQLTLTNSANTVGIIGNLSGVNPNSNFTFYAKTGAAIQYQTTQYASNGATPMQYAVHIRLDFLG